MKHIGKLIFGIITTIIGILLILSNFNIISNLNFFETFKYVWPVGLILAGALIFFNHKILGSVILVITIVFGFVSMTIPDNLLINNALYEEYTEPYNNEKNVSYDLEFGATIFLLNKSSNDNLIEINSNTTLNKKINFNVYHKNNNTEIKMNENGNFGINDFVNLDEQTSKLEINLNSKPISNIDLSFGAVDGVIDLRELKVNKIQINSGASSSKIYFANYPTETYIDCGLSEYTFYFPKDIGVEIDVDGGLLDTDFKDFKKVNEHYYSPNFDPNKENIKIIINAGTSSFKGEYY